MKKRSKRYKNLPKIISQEKKLDLNGIIENVKKSNKIIGIGESGLDFYYNHSEKKAVSYTHLTLPTKRIV